jgi:hypothetical protein
VFLSYACCSGAVGYRLWLGMDFRSVFCQDKASCLRLKLTSFYVISCQHPKPQFPSSQLIVSLLPEMSSHFLLPMIQSQPCASPPN